jgi:hypothetical protein
MEQNVSGYVYLFELGALCRNVVTKWALSNDIIAQYQSIDKLKDEISEYIPEEVIKWVIRYFPVQMSDARYIATKIRHP